MANYYKPPCYGCTDNRRLGCHSECTDYIQWKKDYDEMQKKFKAEQEKLYGMNYTSTYASFKRRKKVY